MSSVESYVQTLKNETNRLIWKPARINGDGTIENIVQVRVEQRGRKLGIPTKGAPKGKHIFLTQKVMKNGKITDELAFRSIKVNMERDTEVIGPKYVDERTGKVKTIPSKYLHQDGMMVKFGRLVRAKKAPGWDRFGSKAMDNAAKHLTNGSNLLAKTQTSVQSASSDIVQSEAGTAKVSSVEATN